MYIQLISIHGLIRGSNIEMGRDADTGGQVRYVLDLARQLSQFDEVERVDLFTRRIQDKRVSEDYSKRVEELNPKCRIVRLPCGGGKYIRKERLWPFLDVYVDQMISFARREGKIPSLVHGHYADAGYVGKEAAAAFGVPFVYTGHSLGRDKLAYLMEQGWSEESANREYRINHRIEMEEECLAAADLVVASTNHERDVQYGRYYGGKETRFEIIPPGIDLERFFPYYEYEVPGSQVIGEEFKQARVRMLRELERFHLHQDKPIILAVCRPDKRKNIGALVEAYGRDLELRELANLAIFAGIRKNIEEMEDSERQVLTDILLMMDRYDIYGHLAIPKRHQSECDVPELYRIAASQRGVFVNPAYVEPFGLTFIEASAVGLPFVGTHNGGPQDIVANCDSGLLVSVDNREEIAKALKQILLDRDKWETLSSNGINRVREYYSWETHCQKYLEAVQPLIEKGRKTSASVKPDKAAPAQRLGSVKYLVLVDIDNTLTGDDEAIRRLCEVMKANRKRVAFGVASGRYLEMIVEALEEHDVDICDVIVASVGTEIYYGAQRTYDKGWASHLRAKWRPERIRDALSQVPFLQIQKDEKTQREYKISFDLDSSVSSDVALPAVHEALHRANASYSLVFSHGSFIDILPHRASKGKAVRYLSNKWGIPIERIATAGDSGNDRDMLVGQTAGIVVGNYDEELESLRRSGARVYFAETPHAGGILEGLRHYRIIADE